MKKSFIYLMFAFLTCSISVMYAQNNQEHETFNSHPLSDGQWDNMILQRQQEWELAGYNGDTQLGILIIPIKSQQYALLASNQLNCTTSSLTTFQYHWIDEFMTENRIKIEDGSEWILDPNNAQILDTWKQEDTLVISPKQQFLWGSAYAYVITNKEKGTSLDANPYDGPIKFGTKTYWVRGISRSESKICLLNGEGDCSKWEISAVDKDLFDTWSHSDTVIVGQNDSYLWWLSTYDYVLINVKRNHYVRAKFISSSCPCKTAAS